MGNVNNTAQQFTSSLNHGLLLLECNFIIDSGQPTKTRSLKGSGIYSVALVATGTYQVSFNNAYNRYLGGSWGFVSPNSGSTNVTALTPGNVYVIATLGTTTQAGWVTAGLNPAVTAAVGVAFVAAATSTGTGTVTSPSVSGINNLEIVGDPQQTITQGSGVIVGNYPYIMVQTLGPTSSGSTVPIPTTPPNGAVLGMNFWVRASSVVGAGETYPLG